MRTQRLVAIAAVTAAGLLSGCSTAIDGVATAPPSADPTQAHLVLPAPPPWTPPAVVRELPEIVTPTGASR